MQNKVKEFNNLRGCHLEPMPVPARLMDIASEFGELAKEYLKHSNYGTDKFQVEDDFKMELGDVMYSLLSLAEEVGVNAEECLDMVIDKYSKRINKGNSMGSEVED